MLGMSVKRAQKEIDSREFGQWCALMGVEPWGDSRADLRIGFLGASLASMQDGKEHKAKRFMPDFEVKPEPKSMTPKESIAFLQRTFPDRLVNPDGTQWKPE